MTIRAGLIGYGPAGRLFHAPLITAAGIELAAVASRRAQEVAASYPQAAVETDPAALLARPDLDLIVIASPNDSHHPLARAALTAGRHVVVDKPFTLTSGQAAELIALADRQRRRLSVFQNRRWDADFLTLRDCLDQGTLGTLSFYQARYDRYRPLVRERWRDRPDLGGGVLLDLGAHLIDQALTLFGWPDWLQADIWSQRPGSGADDGFLLVMGKGACRIVLGASSLAPAAEPRFVVHGDRGSFIKSGLDVQEDQLKAGMRPDAPGFGVEPEAAWARLTLAVPDGERVEPSRRLPSRPGCHLDYYRGIRRAIENDESLPVPAQAGHDVIRLIELARHSHDSGRRLDLSAGPMAKAR